MKRETKGLKKMELSVVFSWILFLLSGSVVHAQSLWPLRAGGDQPDTGRSIAYSVNDTVYVTGTFETSQNDSATFGSLPTTYTSTNDSTDIYVGKLNEFGDWHWMASVSGDETEISHGIAVDHLDTAYVTGQFSGSIDFLDKDGTSSGINLSSVVTQAFVAAINEDGDWLWARQVGSAGNSIGHGISVFTNSFDVVSIYVCGEFNGSAAFGNAPDLNTSHVTGFVGMLTSNGNWRWAEMVDGSGDSAILDITTGPGQNYEGIDRPYIYVTGYFTGTVSFGAFSKTSNGGRDFFYSRMTCNAEMIDSLTAEQASLDVLRRVKVTQRLINEAELFWIGLPGNCTYGTWYCWAFGHRDYGCNPSLACIDGRWTYNLNHLFAFIRYTTQNLQLTLEINQIDSRLSAISGQLALGDVSWDQATHSGGPLDDTGYGVAIDTIPGTGHVFITGEFQGAAVFSPWASGINPADFPMEAKGETDIFVAKLNSAGQYIWSRSAGVVPPDGDPSFVPQPTAAYSIAVDDQGNAFISGKIFSATTFGELEPVETNADFQTQLSDQLEIAEARLAEISVPGATAYGHYVLHKAKYLLDVLGFAPSELGPWDGTYRLSSILGPQAPREYVLSEIGNPYNASNDLEAMLSYVFGAGNWPDLQAWTDGNYYNGELADIEIIIDAGGNVTSMTWEQKRSKSRQVLTLMNQAPVTFPYSSSVINKATAASTVDLNEIRTLLPATPVDPDAGMVSSTSFQMVDGTWMNGDCQLDDELISIQFNNVDNQGAGAFIWNYVDVSATAAQTLLALDSSEDLCVAFDNTNYTVSFDKNHFMNTTDQTGLGTLLPGGGWGAQFGTWTDGDDTNEELQASAAVTMSYTPGSNTLTVTFHIEDDSGVLPDDTNTITGGTNPYQTITHVLASGETDASLYPPGDQAFSASETSPPGDCPIAGNPSPCVWELYPIYQTEQAQLQLTITNLQTQIDNIVNGSSANEDALLAKLTTDGNWARATAGGGPGDDVALDVVTAPNGRIFVTGAFQSVAILGGLSPVTAIGTDPTYNFPNDKDAFVANLDSFLFGAFKRWVIGREVRPPALAINPATNAPYGPPVGIYNAAGDLVLDAFFWMDADLPEDRKLYAVAPGAYTIEWPWELYGQQVPYTGSGSCPSGVMNVEGDCYDPQNSILPAVYPAEPNTGISEWPPNPQVHIAGVPVDLNPPVNLDPDEPDYEYHSLRYSHHDAMVINNVFTNPEPYTYSVILYMQNNQPTYLEVVHSIPWEESPLLEDQVTTVIGKRVTHSVHEDNSGKNGYVLMPKARYDATAYDLESRTGPILPVNTSADPFGVLAPTQLTPHPTAAEPSLVNGIPHYDDDLVVVWFKTNGIGTAWPTVPVRYAPEWPASSGTVKDFAVDLQDVTPVDFGDAFDFALDLKNGNMFWTDISTSQIMRTDRNGSRTSDTADLLTTLSLTPGSNTYDLNALDGNSSYSHTLISDKAILEELIPQLPTGPNDPVNWENTFISWSNGSPGQGDVDGEIVNIIVNTFPDGSSTIDWHFDISTHVTEILELFTHPTPFITSASWPVTVDFNSLLGGSDVHAFLSDPTNLDTFLLQLPSGVNEPNWTRLIPEWTDGTLSATNGELTNITMEVEESGDAVIVFAYQIDDGGIQNASLESDIDGAGGFHRAQHTAISGPRVIVSEGLVGPKGIDVDLVEDKLYWADSTTRKIQRSDLYGSNVENVIETRLEEPVGLALDTTPANRNDHRMYWADPKAKKLYRAYMHDTRHRMTQGILDLFQVDFGVYDLNDIYSQSPEIPYGGLQSNAPPHGGIYPDSESFLNARKAALVTLMMNMAYQLDGTPAGNLSSEFNEWTNGDQVNDPEIENIHIAVHGNGSSELRFLLNQNTLIRTETYQFNREDTYVLLAFFLQQQVFRINAIFGDSYSYGWVKEAQNQLNLVAALPTGPGEPDWAVELAALTDGDPLVGTLEDIVIHTQEGVPTQVTFEYTDGVGAPAVLTTTAGLAEGEPTANLLGLFLGGDRVYSLDIIGGDGTSYEFLSAHSAEIEELLLPIGFSNTFAYRTHELDNPGFLGELFDRWTNGTLEDGELSLIVITVFEDGSSKIHWQYDIQDGYDIMETIIPGYEEIVAKDINGPTRITLDLSSDDPNRHMVYWVDLAPQNNRIQRAFLDGRLPPEELVTDLVSPSGLTHYDRRLYWSDLVTASIHSSNMDGTYSEVYTFGGPYNAPKGINITAYTPPGGSEQKDSVLADAGIDKIVIASQLGSEGLNQPILFPETFPQMSMYAQNSPSLAGFNPNDEHAEFFPSATGSGQEAIFALRDDLRHGSEPYVLLKYRSLIDNEWTMKVYEVVRNGFGYDFSTFTGVAGNPFFAPYPIRLLGTCEGTSGEGEPYFEDYKFNTYAKSAGTITTRFFYPLQAGFYWDEDEYGPIKAGGCVAWLGGDIYDIDEILESEGLFGASHASISNELARIAGILPVGPDQPDWTSLLTAWTNQTFDSDYNLEADSDGELDRVIIEAFKDGSSKMTWLYWESYPRASNTEPLEMVTYIPTQAKTDQILDFFLFRHGYSGLDERYIAPMEVVYNIEWPEDVPTLTVGETLLFPKNGLPDIYNQASVKVIYERPDGEEIDMPRSIVNLIDPMSARDVQLVTADLQGIPQDIAVVNQVGKLVIVGNASGTILVPFSIRSRLSFDPVSGKLSFSGFLDTTVAGEPLLLVNVLSPNERDLLKSLSTNTYYHAVIDELYDLTRNPNQLDLDGDGDPDQSYLLGLEETDSGTQPQSLVGLPKGLTAGAATGTGWVTLVFNDDSTLNPLPVSLSVFRVDCLEYSPNRFSPYIGEIKIIQSDNIFDEQLTLRHSGDFGGNPFDDLNGNGIQDSGEFGLFFEWYYKPDENGVSPPPPEFDSNGTIIPGSGWLPFESGLGLQEISIEGANLTTLSDNWFFVRYKGYPVCRNDFEFTQLAGDPASTPTHPRGALAEGWIKRVVRRLNAFEARVQDFHAAPTNTFASMIGQVGERYEGPIAMNNNPDNLNSMGLIEAYETVLRRGMSLSVDGTPPINYGPANKALLLVANRIAGFYALLANEAYADALDPTIGYDTASEFGYVAPTLFAFQNQQDSLLAEELALLRGRDDYSAGVAASPVYNRLYWNFTSGDGEVAYEQAYNVHDQDYSGVVDETDARILFPQGHGDAWGHHLTSLKTFYKLLNHPYYSWEPRAEAVTVAGVAIQVDYEDERKFAEVAAQKAKVGAQIVNMTYREKYVADPAGQWQGYKDSDEDRAWGLSEWAKRTGQGAYIDWVVANSILPVEDLDHTGLEKIDRTSVFELQSIAAEFGAIQSELDKADSGNNPLGLTNGAIAFDIDPSEVDAGHTHFEQIYERAMGNLPNALFVFDQANDLNNMLRMNQDTVDAFTGNIYDQDFDFMSRLIEVFGYPYDGDIGPGGTYPTGYDGPDIFHFNYVDYERLTGQKLGRIETWTTAIENSDALENWLGDWWDPAGLDGSFRDDPIDKWTDHLKNINTVTYHFVTPEDGPDTPTISFHDYYHNSFTVGIGLAKPDPSWGERRANGEIQFALSELIQAIAEMDISLNEYDRHIDTMMGTITDIEMRYKHDLQKSTQQWDHHGVLTGIDVAIGISMTARTVLKLIIDNVDSIKETAKEAPPKMVGLSNDIFSAIRAAAEVTGGTAAAVLQGIADGLETAENISGLVKDGLGRANDIELEDLSAKHELGVFIREFEAQVRQEPGLRLELYLQLDRVRGKAAAYKSAVAKGNRLLDELIIFRKNAAAATQDYRYRDMFFRIMRNASLQKYHAQFDLAAKYVYMAAAAYDYETNLLGTNSMVGQDFLTSIVKQRNLGEMEWTNGGELIPLPGRAGLADPMARMKANFDVLKPQLGFNNPQIESNRFSVREELFRISPDNDLAWQDELQEHLVADIWQIPEFKRYCRPFAPPDQGEQPGIVIPFTSNVTSGLNFFGWPLGSGDSAYDPSQFATRIRGIGVWFDNYDGLGLANTPRVYLVPAGMDVLRSPDATNFEVREWQVVDQKLPVPLPLTLQDVEEPDWIPIHHSLSDDIHDIRQYSAFRAYHDSGTANPNEFTMDSRLIGRSVWNTRWVLIIPGAYMLDDADAALNAFIQGVGDIKFTFDTYAYSGNKRKSDEAPEENASDEKVTADSESAAENEEVTP